MATTPPGSFRSENTPVAPLQPGCWHSMWRETSRACRSANFGVSPYRYDQQQPRQTGVLLKHRQQVQPASMHWLIQSQQAWIMAQQALSPLVQVTHTPSFVASHLPINSAQIKLQFEFQCP